MPRQQEWGTWADSGEAEAAVAAATADKRSQGKDRAELQPLVACQLPPPRRRSLCLLAALNLE